MKKKKKSQFESCNEKKKGELNTRQILIINNASSKKSK